MVRLRFFDAFFLILSLLVTGVTAFLTVYHRFANAPPLVEIQSQRGVFLYPLAVDRDLMVLGPAGITRLRIREMQVWAISSPGPLKIMMKMGKIHQSGQWIASLPNHVFVRIVGGKPSQLDANLF